MPISTVKWIAKALIGGAIAFAGAMVTGLSDGAMQAQEWWVAIASGLTALGSVFGISNGPKPR